MSGGDDDVPPGGAGDGGDGGRDASESGADLNGLPHADGDGGEAHHGEAAIAGALDQARVVAFPGQAGGPAEETKKQKRKRKARGQKPDDPLNCRLAQLETNDLGNADRLIARYGQDCRYVREVGWHHWDGRRWAAKGGEEKVAQCADLTARSVMEEVDAVLRAPEPFEDKSQGWMERRAADLFKWSEESGNNGRLTGMVKRAQNYLSVSPEDLDGDPFLLNVENGTLVLQGDCQSLRPHERGDMLSKIVAAPFDPEATCASWRAFLDTVQPDKEVQRFLQTWVGYCLTGHIGEQKLVFFYGQGSNGKGVFVNTVAHILADYSRTLPFESLLKTKNKRGGDATPDLARLPGARFVRAAEPDEGTSFAEATIKQITGGEEIIARHNFKDFFEFMPDFKLTLSGNHKPHIRGADHGIWRRFLLVPWPVIIPDERQDLDLADRLWEERAGILQWMLDGARLWLESGLVVPSAVQSATDEYRRDSDPIGRFMADCVAPEIGAAVQVSEMYGVYCAWCRWAMEKPWTQKSFARTMVEKKGVRRVRRDERLYVDVALKPDRPGRGESDPPPAREGEYDD